MRVRILHDAKPRTAPVARRRDGDIAPYRHETRVWSAATGRECGAQQRGASVAHGNGARVWGAGVEHGNGTRAGRAGAVADGRIF